jgi:hypothetical protein
VVQVTLVLVFFIVVLRVPNDIELNFLTQFLVVPALDYTVSACAESTKCGPHWSADVIQSNLVLVFFIVVPRVPNGMVLSFLTQFLVLPALDYIYIYSNNLPVLNLLNAVHTGQLMWYNRVWYWYFSLWYPRYPMAWYSVF